MGRRYTVAWASSIVAGVGAVLILVITAVTFGNMPPLSTSSGDLAGGGVLIGQLIGVVLFPCIPLVLSLTALASSKGRPKGRIGFFPLVLAVAGIGLCVTSTIVSTVGG
jgi:hypothetical protein